MLSVGSLLAQFVRDLPEGVYLVNEDGVFVDGNQALLDLLAVPSLTELRNRRVEETFVQPDEWSQSIGSMVEGGGVWEFDRDVRRMDGEVASVLDLGCVVAGGAGRERLYCGILVDITHRLETERELRGLLTRDPLTGCYNRRFLEQFARAHTSRHDRWGAIVIDIDDFKRFNDEHGHQAGDDALVQLTGFLQRSVRSEDAVIRMGGDEFLVLLSGEHGRHVSIVADRIRQTAGRAGPVPFSLGKAVRYRAESLEETIARADRKLLHIKVQGRRHRRRRGERT